MRPRQGARRRPGPRHLLGLDGHLAFRVAEEYALRELWAKAGNNYLVAGLKGGLPQTTAVWRHQAVVRVQLKDELTYRAVCQALNKISLAASPWGRYLCRAGRHSDAVVPLKQALALSAEIGQKDRDPQDWIFLAMAHHHLGDAPQAQLWLEKIRQHSLPAPGKRSWADLEFDLLRREIESLLAVKSAEPKK